MVNELECKRCRSTKPETEFKLIRMEHMLKDATIVENNTIMLVINMQRNERRLTKKKKMNITNYISMKQKKRKLKNKKFNEELILKSVKNGELIIYKK